MVKVRQVACPVSPRWTVGGTPDQSVTVNGSVGIFMRSHPAFLGDHRAVCRLLEALRHQANPADRGRTLIESDHHVGDIGFLEQGHFVFGQLDANRGQRVVEVLELGSADNGRGDNRLSQGLRLADLSVAVFGGRPRPRLAVEAFASAAAAAVDLLARGVLLTRAITRSAVSSCQTTMAFSAGLCRSARAR